MYKWSSIYSFIYFSFSVSYFYLITTAIYLITSEKEFIEKNDTVFKGLAYGSIVETIIFFIFLIKFVLILTYKCENVMENDIISRIEGLSFFSWIPYFCNFFLLVAQFTYFNGVRFLEKEEFMEHDVFREYVISKFVIGYIFMTYFMCIFFGFCLKMLCISCNYCKCCRTCLFSENLGRNNKIYPY